MKYEECMKIEILKILAVVFVLLAGTKAFSQNENDFDYWFEDHSLRVDFVLNGNDKTESFVLKQLKKQEYWAGTLSLSTTESPMGNYRFCVYDSASNKLLYSQGFCSLFQEWQATPEAKQRQESYYHVSLFPFPKRTVIYKFEKRAYDDGLFHVVHSEVINPNNYFIHQEKPLSYPVRKIAHSGNHHKKVDIAFLAEGYTSKDMKKFRADVEKVWNYICSISPFDANKEQFNIWAVESPSEEQGTDVPGEGIYRNTIFNSTFYTFNTDRYLTTTDMKSMHDAAAGVPADQIFVLVNTERYGGGGFYNFYSMTSVDNSYALKVAIHEFGHGFAGLADEYFDSEVAYEDYYNRKVEPWEPNITTLVDFGSKWKSMIEESTPQPTPRTDEFYHTLGLFEGGGYMSKGVYSPVQDCRMKSNVPKGFCPVCEKAIQKTIESYTK